MTNGIILAGGRGSRLGPLAAQISKALVSIGQRPHLAHQVELLHNSGVDDIVVVTSPDTHTQVYNMLRRAGIDNVRTVVQDRPRGPVDAIRIGLEEVDLELGTFVLMSDTYLDEKLQTPDFSWIGMGSARYSRSFCRYSVSRDAYVDETVDGGATVTIGAYYLHDSVSAYSLAASVVREGKGLVEVGMAPFLNRYVAAVNGAVKSPVFSSWLDLGDVKALGEARRDRFIARDHHTLELTNYGTIVKTGDQSPEFAAQGDWLYTIANDGDPRVANLVPRVYSFVTDMRATLSYEMEFIDLPTLSELWLYWPGRPDTWADILETVISALQPLWHGEGSLISSWASDHEYAFYSGKAMRRLYDFDRINGTVWATKLKTLIDQSASLFEEASPSVRAHGDLNFNNIMFSLNTGMVKLVDPRGDERLPLSYELAKLRYSYHGGFSAITHGLFTYERLLPDREFESLMMDEVIARYDRLDKITACEAMLLFAGSPLHSHSEGHMMILRGRQLLEGLFK